MLRGAEGGAGTGAGGVLRREASSDKNTVKRAFVKKNTKEIHFQPPGAEGGAGGGAEAGAAIGDEGVLMRGSDLWQTRFS